MANSAMYGIRTRGLARVRYTYADGTVVDVTSTTAKADLLERMLGGLTVADLRLLRIMVTGRLMELTQAENRLLTSMVGAGGESAQIQRAAEPGCGPPVASGELPLCQAKPEEQALTERLE